MRKSILSIGYAVSLLVSAPSLAEEAGTHTVLAAEQAGESLKVAREVIRAELAQSMRPSAVTPALLQTALSGKVELAEIPCASTTSAGQ